MGYAWAIGLAAGLVSLPAMARVIGIARRRVARGRRWTLADCLAEFVVSWLIVLAIAAAAGTGFFVVFELARRLNFFVIPASSSLQSWLTLAGLLLGVWA